VCSFSCLFISFIAENYVKTLLCAIAEAGINFLFSKKVHTRLHLVVLCVSHNESCSLSFLLSSMCMVAHACVDAMLRLVCVVTSCVRPMYL
jgi:hypothetical protein